jgi:hypothetical protein
MPEWFVSLAHAKTMIEVWRREFNEERPKKVLGGLTPSDYARQLAVKSVTVTADSNPRATEKLGYVGLINQAFWKVNGAFFNSNSNSNADDGMFVLWECDGKRYAKSLQSRSQFQ